MLPDLGEVTRKLRQQPKFLSKHYVSAGSFTDNPKRGENSEMFSQL